MAHARITILWTIVIVFISQLFHCAYTNQRDQGIFTATISNNNNILAKSSNEAQGLSEQHSQLRQIHKQAQQSLPRNYDYEQPLQQGQLLPAASLSDQSRETYEELVGSSSGASLDDFQPQDLQPPPQQQQSVSTGNRERCRELISMSFKDLTPEERALEEMDCGNLREQIAAAAAAAAAANKRNNQLQPRQQQQQRPNQRSRPQQAAPLEQLDPALEDQPALDQGGSSRLPALESSDAGMAAGSQQDDELPLGSPIQLKNGQLVATRGRQFQAPHLFLAQSDHQFNASSSSSPAGSSYAGWPPRSSYATQLQQMLLQQQHSPRRSQGSRQLYQQQQPAITSSSNSDTQQTTAATTTTFEPEFETTRYPTTTTTSSTTTSTTTTTTTTTTPAPKIRVAGGRRRHSGKAMARSSTTTTTTTTTTQKPSTLADYADGSDLSTDYYDEYDDQQQATTTTTTTTSRPNRRGGGGGRRPGGGKRYRQQTTPKPTTTTTTTLSPGYQQRPDGRIIDYMADPNFPRELKGADLTHYPFYINVPEKIGFECKGRHDGYYTNIDLHCQIYHHCAVGNRYDFLCPNYTLFDQTTFTCRFINTVDCPGSEKHFDRNNALYVEKDEKAGSASSSATSTTTTTTTTTTQAPRLNLQLSHRVGGRAPHVSLGEGSKDGPISALAVMKTPRAISGIGAPADGTASRNRRAIGNGDHNYWSNYDISLGPLR